jgi:hypothetical protein
MKKGCICPDATFFIWIHASGRVKHFFEYSKKLGVIFFQ